MRFPFSAVLAALALPGVAQDGVEVRALLSTNRVWLAGVASQEVASVRASVVSNAAVFSAHAGSVNPHGLTLETIGAAPEAALAAKQDRVYTPASSFTFATNAGGLTVTGFVGAETVLSIPPAIDGLPVVSVGDCAFRDCDGLVRVTVPEGVTNIGYQAFALCGGLARVDLPDSLLSIGAEAFNNSRALTELTIPGRVTDVGDWAFYYCLGLTGTALPESVTAVGEKVFYYCTGLTSAAIPSGLTSVPAGMFYRCSRVSRVTIPAGVTNIAAGAFSHCTNLYAVYFEGDAPGLGTTPFSDTPATNYFLHGRAGFTDPFAGRPTLTYAPEVYGSGAWLTGITAAQVGAAKALQSKSFLLSNPTAAADSPLWRTPGALSVSSVHVLCLGGVSITGNFWEYDADGGNGEAVDNDIVGLSGADTADDGTLANPGIAAGNYLGWKTTAVSGAVTRVIVTVEYVEN